MWGFLLLILIIPIVLTSRNIKSILTPTGDRLTILSSFVVFFLFTFYAYNHLPYSDHRAYKVGNRLTEQMQKKPGNPLTLYKLQNINNGAVTEMANYPDDYQNWKPYINPEDSLEKYFRSVDEELTIKHIKVKSTGQKNRVTEIPDELSEDWEIIKEETNVYFPDLDPKIYDLTAESIEDNFEISFDRELATAKIETACAGSDLLVTHNHLGEYGHVYHVFVNSVVAEIDIPKVYFGYSDDNDNNLLILPKTYGNLKIPCDILEWTAKWIEQETPVGKYQCDPEAIEVLKEHTNGLNFDVAGKKDGLNNSLTRRSLNAL